MKVSDHAFSLILTVTIRMHDIIFFELNPRNHNFKPTFVEFYDKNYLITGVICHLLYVT